MEGIVPLKPGDEVALGRTLLRLGSGTAELERLRQQRTVELGREAPTALIAVSPAMTRLVELARRVARSDLTVLVTGETGAGKEVLARYLHENSPRAAGPFVVVNAPALPQGLVESELFGVEAGVATGVTARPGMLEKADKGTLFLDEVGELPLDVQPKLLRFLQEKTVQRVGGRRSTTVDVRIVSATNRDLESAIAQGAFRADLYFRLSAVKLAVPPLRDRPEDIVALASVIQARAAGSPRRLSSAAVAAMAEYPFPGNVRELVSMIERAVHLAEGEEILPEDLGLSLTKRSDSPAPDGGAALLEAVVAGSADFWKDVYEPFRRREIPRAVLQELVDLGLDRAGGSVPALSRLLRVEGRYRKLLDFLRNSKLSTVRNV